MQPPANGMSKHFDQTFCSCNNVNEEIIQSLCASSSFISRDLIGFISKENKSYQLNLDNGIYLYKLTSNEIGNDINGKLIISKN